MDDQNMLDMDVDGEGKKRRGGDNLAPKEKKKKKKLVLVENFSTKSGALEGM